MENLNVYVGGAGVLVRWEEGEARFSVALELQPHLPGEPRGGEAKPPLRPFQVEQNPRHQRLRYTLVKSVPDPSWRGRNGHRATRHLDATNAKNSKVVSRALAEAEALGLYEKAVEERHAAQLAEADKRLTEQADKARAALASEEQRLLGEGKDAAADAISQYLSTADRDSLARFYRIVRAA